MKRYWTADLHFGHANIARYCNRPSLRKTDVDEKGNWVSDVAALACAERMDNFLIKNFNMRVKPEDLVVHVGDFINRGMVKGTPGLKNNPQDYIACLNGSWTLTLGNHDRNNKVKAAATHLFTKISHFNVFVSHYPIENGNMYDRGLVEYVLNNTDFQLCGHVHNAWQYKFHNHKHGNYLMYNVGVDVQKYIPISDDEVIKAYMMILRNKTNTTSRPTA
jgi:calcineurin-like phosphoesterase family protein